MSRYILPTTSAIRLAAACIVIAIADAIGGTVVADTMPKPIGEEDLRQIYRRLLLSHEQQVAADRKVEVYAKKCHEMLSEPKHVIEQMPSSLKELPTTREPKNEFKQILTAHRIHMDRLKALDEEFFNEVAPILNEVQQERLTFIRLYRSRHRLFASSLVAAWFGSHLLADWTDLLDVMKHDQQVFADALPVLIGYEADMAVDLQRLWNLSLQIYDDAIAAKWVDENEMEQAWLEAARPGRIIMVRMYKRNHDTIQVLGSVRGVQEKKLKEYYYHLCYPHEFPGPAGMVRRIAQIALSVDGLNEDDRAVISALLAAFQDVEAKLSQNYFNALELKGSYELLQIGSVWISNLEWGETPESIGQVQLDTTDKGYKRVILANSTIEKIETIASKEHIKALWDAQERDGTDGDINQMPEPRADRLYTRLHTAIPQPLSNAAFERIVDVLALSDEQVQTWREVYMGYIHEYEGNLNTDSERIAQLHIGFGPVEVPSQLGYFGIGFSSAANVTDAFDILKRALSAARGRDAAFYKTLEGLPLTERQRKLLPLVRVIRVFDLNAGALSRYPEYEVLVWPQTTLHLHAAGADLPLLVQQLPGSFTDNESAIHFLTGLATETDRTYMAAQDAEVGALHKHFAIQSIVSSIAPVNDPALPKMNQDYQQLADEAHKRRRTWIQCIHRIFDNTTAHLDESKRELFVSSFHQAVYPDVAVRFSQTDEGIQLLAAAYNVPNFTVEQKREMDELRIAHLDTIEQLRIQILSSLREYFCMDIPTSEPTIRTLAIKIRNLWEQRDDAHGDIARQLRRILRTEQLQSLPQLTNVKP